MTDLPKIAFANRPDLVGYAPDSPTRQSKYIEAVQRLVASIRARNAPIDPKDVRGKRRLDPSRPDVSNTLRSYLRQLEMFSYWCRGKYGYELDPKDVTRRIAFEYLEWMSTLQDPNINVLRTRDAPGEGGIVFAALERTVKLSKTGQVGLREIYEQLPPSAAQKYSLDAAGMKKLHGLFGKLIIQYRSILRLPTIAALRAEVGGIYSPKETDYLMFRYSIRPRIVYQPASIRSALGALSSLWEAMTEGDNVEGGEAPLQYNPWRGRRSPMALAHARHKEQMRRVEKRVISNPIIDALIEATVGTDLESRRNRAALLTLIYTGVRAEELVGALRRDLVNVDDVLSLRVFGKGDKLRTIPIYSEVREAFAQLDVKLEEMSQSGSRDPDARWLAAYATTLLQSKDAPIIPSMPRWGANYRDSDPTKAALEPLDTSGLRAILNKLQDRARVYDRQIEIVRPLNPEEAALVHPHALRHYAATAAQQAGLPMEEVQRMLGHEDLRTTQTYVHISPKSMTQFGAYIAYARSGAVMSPEEAAKLKTRKKSELEDPSIMAAPAQRPGKRSIPSKPKPASETFRPPAKTEPAQPAVEPQPQPQEQEQGEALPIDLDAPIAWPFWAYQLGAEVLDLYLPQGYQANRLPKGQGARLTLRIGRLSRLPWWAGRANKWKFEQMAPIVSYFQMFSTEQNSESIRKPLESAWEEVLEKHGVTAASAYSEWVAEILGHASAMWFDAMRTRVDEDGLPEEWITFDEPARPSDEIVRMHPTRKILEWFEKNALAAEAPIVRTPPSWMRWNGSIRIVSVEPLQVPEGSEEKAFRTVIQVDQLPGIDSYFKPRKQTEVDMDVDIFHPGPGKGSKRVRYRNNSRKWSHGIVTKREIDPSEPLKALVTIEGDLIPDDVRVLQASWDEVKREKAKRSAGEYYPMLADMVKLPEWFFSDDPLAELPKKELDELREWLDKIQGRALSRVRVTSSASELWNLMLSWRDASVRSRQPGLSFDEEALRRQAVLDYEDRIRKLSIEMFTVEINPSMIVGQKGANWARQAKKTDAQAFQMMAPELNASIERELERAGATIEQLAAWAKKLPAGEKRIFAYVQMKLGAHIPITKWGLSAAVIQTQEGGLLSQANLNWQDGTIKHSEAFKRQFFLSHGTDSECVVRRMVRHLWERKKSHDFEYLSKSPGPTKPIHRDILHRHINALMAYLIPCPKKIEEKLRTLLEQTGAPLQFRNMQEALDEESLGQFKDQPMELRKWWLAYKGEQELETELGMRIGYLEQIDERYEPERRGQAKPNLGKAVRVVPNFVSLAFAEYWPV